MKKRNKNKPKLIDEFIRISSQRGKIRLVAGVNPNPPDPYPSAIFYIRMESQDRDSREPCKTESIWLTLNEMTRLGVLMNIASRFWVEKFYKGEPYSEERISDFVTEYNEIKTALKRLLPKEQKCTF